MSIQCSTEVEFIGGPIDGYANTMTVPLRPFLGVKLVDKSQVRPSDGWSAVRNMIQRLCQDTAVRVAVYRLEWRAPNRQCYQFLGTRKATPEQLQSPTWFSTLVRDDTTDEV